MRKCGLLVLLLIIVFPLYSQTDQDILMHVPPIIGTGSSPHDNNIFYRMVVRELTAWGGITLIEETREADYLVSGVLTTPFPQSYSLQLILTDKDSIVLFEQTLHYLTMDEVGEYVPSIMFNIIFQAFANKMGEDASFELLPIPVTPVVEEEIIEEPEEPVIIVPWQNRPWYFGASLFWAPRFYSSDTRVSGNFANIGFGFYAEHYFIHMPNEKLSFLKMFLIRTGFEFAPDWIIATDRYGDEYRNMILQIPLLINYVWKPNAMFMHLPYLGCTFNIPFFPYTTVPPVSFRTGFQTNKEIGPGIGFADASFSFDFGKSGLNKDNKNDKRQYNRYMLYIGIGYKFGIGDHLQRIPRRGLHRDELETYHAVEDEFEDDDPEDIDFENDESEN